VSRLERLVSTEILVIGSGIAGLSFALKAAEHGSVTVVTKKQRAASSTNYAQGGIAAVVAADDTIELHARDTLVAGAGLCHAAAVTSLVRDGPARLRELIDWGVAFTLDHGELSLGREGGHSRRRIVHAGDLTGREIERALLAALAARPNVRLHEDQLVLDLLTGYDARSGRARSIGALVFDHRHNERIRYDAPVVFLATGGLGQAYLHTTNPEIATGDGAAMAYRAGAQLANLEFVQFHPTALYPAGENAFLISEAVRGEGAVLRHRSGDPLMEGVHPLGSLAPRDVVARTIDFALKQTGEPHVMLDVSAIPADRFEDRFPGILAGCLERGVDPRDGGIPVVPAAHYACGGIRTDAGARTCLAGLFAAGEVACTGVHGANRLASNSLLEAVVYSHRAAAEVPLELARAERAWPSGHVDEAATPAPEPDATRRTAWSCARNELRRLMWRNAGIVRSLNGLDAAAHRLRELQVEFERDAADTLDPEWIELRNLIEASRLIVRSAQQRRESRGLHYLIDHPYRDNERYLRDTLLVSNPTQESY